MGGILWSKPEYKAYHTDNRGFNDWGRKSEGGGFFKSSNRMFNRGMTRLTRSAYRSSSRHHRKRLKR